MLRDRKSDDIVVTGVAALTPLGLGFEETRRGLRKGISRLDAACSTPHGNAGHRLCTAALPHFDPKDILGRKGLRSKDRYTLIVLSCIQLDLAEQLAEVGDATAIGLTLGTTFGSLTSQVGFSGEYERGGARGLNAMDFPNVVINTAASQANIWFDLAGSSTTLSNGFTAGLDAVVFSADQLRAGRAQQLVAGGADELSPLAAAAFRRLGLTSPSASPRPFDRARDGTGIGEGAAFVLMETREHADRRGAPVLARVVGYASAFDGTADFAYAPRPDAMARAMEGAMGAAGLSAEEIDFIAASGSGSVAGDQIEALAIRRVFGEAVERVPVVAYKSYWGECLGASAAMQLAAAVADLKDGVVSPTLGFESSEEGLQVTREVIGGLEPKTVMINACGHTGHNTSLILTTA